MKFRLPVTLPATLLFIGLSGCSYLSDATGPGISSPIPTDLDLYLSRTSMTGTDFEHYTLTKADQAKSVLLRECGEVSRGRFIVREQSSFELETPLETAILETANALDTQLTGSKHTFEVPGQNKNLFDPGQVFLKFGAATQERKIETALDSVRDPKGLPERKILKLTKLLRSAGLPDAEAAPKICGHSLFYGLGWEQP